MPPKEKSKSDTKTSRRRSIRLEEKEESKKKTLGTTTNLKDLLKRSNSSLRRKSGIEKDGDFVFKRTSSQLEDSSSSKQNKKPLPSSSSSNASKKPKLNKKPNIRKLTAKDILITPEVNRVNDAYKEHSTSIQIPISDSPIIRRNKETKNNKDRRSSLSHRGKRVSSIGNGFSGVPHEQIPTSEYYKHLNSDLPDPHKMRQLLIWCSKKKFEDDKNKHIKQKNKLSNEELTALNIAKVIKEEVVRDLVEGKINISWWNKDDDNENNASSQEVKIVPNERNVKNQQVLKDLEKRLIELKSKTEEWEKTLSENVEIQKPKQTNDFIKSQLNNNEEFGQVISNSIIDEITKLQDSTFNDISDNLEFDVDVFNDNVHKLQSASSIRSKFTLLKSKKLSEILDSTFDDDTLEKIQHSEVNKDIDTDQLLRGISKLDS